MKELVCSTSDMTRLEWLKARQIGIGGSDASKAIGLSRWGGAFSVYMSKVREYTEEDAEDNSEKAYWGHELEEKVAQEFTKRTGFEVATAQGIYRDTEHPFMIANVDRVLVEQNVGLECKTCGERMAYEWEGDEIPDSYYCQVQHYIQVMEWDGCWIACLIGGQRFVYKYVPRNDSFIEQLIEAEEELWKRILTRDPPAVSYADAETVKGIFENIPEMIEPTDEDRVIRDRLVKAKQSLEECKKEVETLELRLKQRIGEKSGIIGVATWKTTKPKKEVDWKTIAEVLNGGADKPFPEDLIRSNTHDREGHRIFRIAKGAVA